MTDKKSRLISLGMLSIGLAGIILFSNILNAPFVFDDYTTIVDNDSIKNVEIALRDIVNNRYLSSLSFSLNYALGGLKPFGYHLINNIIHVINALLVYYLVILTFRTPHMVNAKLSAQFIAFSSAFIFAVHPIQTQAVTYIAQRATSMATFFYLLSLVSYVKWRLKIEQQTSRAADHQEKRKNYCTVALLLYCASLISAILAMKSKEIAFTLPLTVALYEFYFLKEISSQKRLFYLLPIILTTIILPLSFFDMKGTVETITQDINLHSKETTGISRLDYLLTQFRVIMTYLRLVIFPINQSLDYNYTIYHSFFNPQTFLSFLFIILLFGIGVYLFYASRTTHHTLRLAAFGIFWFFITLSVESSIIPIKDVIFEHRLYLPSIGLFIASVSMLGYFLRQTKVRLLFIIIIMIMLSLSTYNRNAIWRDPQTLWEDVLSKSPDNIRAYNALGVIYKNQGEYAIAMRQFERALKINPNYTPIYYNLGDVQYKLGNYKNAVAYFKKALSLKLSYHFHLDILNSLAITYSEMGDDDNAVNTFNEAIRLFPKSIMLYNNLGRQYIKMGKFDLAIETLEKGLKIREDLHLRYNLTAAYAKEYRKR